MRQRAIALRLLHKGYKPEQVAELVAIRANTIWTWHRRWREGGLAGLQDQPRSGRPRKATAEYCRVLEETLNSDPASYGYSFTVWTMDRLRAHLEQKTGIRLSQTRFAMVLEREGYVYRRPKRDLTPKQNQTAKQQAAELLDELKKGRNVVISSFSCLLRKPGRDNLEPELPHLQLLDETGTAENHPRFQWQTRVSPCHWSLQLAHG